MKTNKRTIPYLLVLIPILVSCLSCLSGDDAKLRELLRARTGLVFADVGAGNGEWVESLVEWVGPEGQVIATEVDSSKVDKIKRKVNRSGWENVQVILGDQKSTGLPQDCCDGVLLRLVYHHFEKPETMTEDLFQSIRSGGLIAVIDFVPSSYLSRSNIPSFRDGHGVDPKEVRQQMEDVGFTFIEEINEWDGHNDRFLLLFEK